MLLVRFKGYVSAFFNIGRQVSMSCLCMGDALHDADCVTVYYFCVCDVFN